MKATPAFDPTLPDKARKAGQEASDTELQGALEHAADFLGTLPWKGKKLDPDQLLSWPRSGVFVDGQFVTDVPEAIQNLNSLVAGFILADIPFDIPALTWVFLHAEPFLEEGASLSDISKTLN